MKRKQRLIVKVKPFITYPCPFCASMFSRRSHLLLHVRDCEERPQQKLTVIIVKP